MKSTADLLCFIAIFSGCAHLVPGGFCLEGQARCSEDGNVALVCTGKVVTEYVCSGPSHCSTAPDRVVTCDQSTAAAPGTACLEAYEGMAHCAVGEPSRSRVQCLNGTWFERPCPENNTCKDVSGVTSCVASEIG